MPTLAPPPPQPRIPCFCPECSSEGLCILESIHGMEFTSTLCCDVEPRLLSDPTRPLYPHDFKRILKDKRSEHLQD